MAYYFVTGRGSDIQKTRFGVFRSLLHQIFSQRLDVSLKFVNEFKERTKLQGEHGSKWTWNEAEVRNFLKVAVLKASSDTHVELFIDALDEVGSDEAVSLLEYFLNLIDEGGNLSVCVSSRHYPLTHINHNLAVCVEDYNSDDIATYVRSKLNGLTRSEIETKTIAKEITARSWGVFQWVHLVLPKIVRLCRYGSSLAVLQTEIRKVPQALGDLYQSLLSDVTAEEKVTLLQLMRWICFSTRSLSLTELRYAMAIDFMAGPMSITSLESSDAFKKTDTGMRLWIVDLSRGLVEVKPLHGEQHHDAQRLPHPSPKLLEMEQSCDFDHEDDDGDDAREGSWLVQLNHQSVHDFVVQLGLRYLSNDTDPKDEAAVAHHFCLKSCIRLLSAEDLQRSILAEYHKTSPVIKPIASAMDGLRNTERWRWGADFGRLAVGLEKILEKTPFLGYACTEWVSHGKEVESSQQKELLADLVFLFQWPSRDTFECWALLKWASHWNDRHVNSKRDIEVSSPMFHRLAIHGFSCAMAEILRSGRLANPDFVHNARTALSYAAEYGHITIVAMLLKTHKVDPNAADQYERTPLTYASMNGHEAVAKLLVEDKRVNPNVAGASGFTPMLIAAKRKASRIVALLLENSPADVNTRDQNNRTALYLAAAGGDDATVDVLLKCTRTKVDIKDTRGQTPLHIAVQGGHVGSVQLLLSSGRAMIEAKDESGYTPLHCAPLARANCDVVMRLMIDKGANVDAREGTHSTALHLAAEMGQIAQIELLLRHGADINAKNEAGRVPLAWAFSNKNKDVVEVTLENDAAAGINSNKTPPSSVSYAGPGAVVQLLLKKGANVNTRCNRGWSPLHMAVFHKNAPAVRLLVENGANIDTRSKLGWTPLHTAAHVGSEKMFQLLLEKGANINTKAKSGWTPLHQAVSSKQDATVKFILDAGADMNVKNKNGESPLFMAVLREFQAIVEIMLPHCADIESRDNHGRTLLMVAAGNLQVHIMKLLIGSGADPNSRDTDCRTALFSVVGVALSPRSSGYALFESRTWQRMNDAIDLLDAAGLHLNDRDSHRLTALAYAYDVAYSNSNTLVSTNYRCLVQDMIDLGCRR